ncbi:MAG: glutathione S-transferase N-terminal domain-containing protein [Proteobacteria bacterium]|nr:glutathione S-transferase N-terminal domain-containing protein [Pseudomonadota bacterium]
MIDFYFAATPNGLKVALFLAETGLAHRVVPVSLRGGEQHAAAFRAISPNGKIPAIVDHAPADGGAPLPVFESGAILWYLAEKHGVLLPAAPRARLEVHEWLIWQVAGLGPMAGQAGHFSAHAPEPVPYALERYRRETARLYGVLDARLAGREFLVGDYSIADLAAYPWVVPHAALGHRLADTPHLARWLAAIAARPATQRVYAGVEDVYARPRSLSDADRRALFGTPAAAARA